MSLLLEYTLINILEYMNRDDSKITKNNLIYKLMIFSVVRLKIIVAFLYDINYFYLDKYVPPSVKMIVKYIISFCFVLILLHYFLDTRFQ